MICDAVGLDLAVLELAWLVLRLMILHRPTRLAGSRIRVMRIPA
jgi:hypothetical protein